MNLSFPPFERDAQARPLPPDMAVMLVGVAARQAASPTAMFFSRIDRTPFEASLLAPSHGAFNAPVAAALMRWKAP